MFKHISPDYMFRNYMMMILKISFSSNGLDFPPIFHRQRAETKVQRSSSLARLLLVTLDESPRIMALNSNNGPYNIYKTIYISYIVISLNSVYTIL